MGYEHDFYCGLGFWAVMIGIINVAGPGMAQSMDAAIDANRAELDSIRQKENVSLQLESEYRARLKDAYTQVKRRLDYQLQTANVLRANEQRHMVDWILTNVKKSITAKQEEDALKKCVADLKALAK